jgi:hypothetical protein
VSTINGSSDDARTPWGVLGTGTPTQFPQEDGPPAVVPSVGVQGVTSDSQESMGNFFQQFVDAPFVQSGAGAGVLGVRLGVPIAPPLGPPGQIPVVGFGFLAGTNPFNSTPAGVYGESVGDGVMGRTLSDKHAGVAGINSGGGVAVIAVTQDGPGPALFATGGGTGKAGHFDGDVELNGNLTTNGALTTNTLHLSGLMTVDSQGDISFADCAEDFEVADPDTSEPGTVMCIDDDGRLAPCGQPYDTRVAGIISGAANLRPAILLGRVGPGAPSAPLALTGKVCCKVDATDGPIRRGDLLTTSRTLGHAMVVRDRERATGAVIGKALAPLSEGRALIPVLVCNL